MLSLTGRLGAGKTHFTKGLVEGLGCRESVTSPTFALLQEYHGGEVPVYHFDLYRLESVEEVLDLGWDDYLEGDGIVVAEWGDKFPELFPENAIWLEIAEEGAGRVIRPTVPG